MVDPRLGQFLGRGASSESLPSVCQVDALFTFEV